MYTGKIIDTHAHIYPDKIAGKAVEAIAKFYDIPMNGHGMVADLLSRSDKAGVSRVLVHSTATKPEQVISINDFIIGETKKSERLIGFGTMHPDFDGIESEIERIISFGLQGVKLHPDFQQFDVDSEGAQNIYRACENKIPLLLHIGDYRTKFSEPSKLMRMVEKFPDVTFIAAHFGGWSVWEESYRTLEPRPNLFMDTSSSLFMLDKELARKIIKKHGAEKFLFGTDYPMWDSDKEVRRVLELGLTPDEFELIFYKNAEKLLNSGGGKA